MKPVLATQCVNCGHVGAPALQLFSCDACGSFDIRIFEAIEEEEAPVLSRTAAEKLLAAIQDDEERWTLTPLGEGAYDE